MKTKPIIKSEWVPEAYQEKEVGKVSTPQAVPVLLYSRKINDKPFGKTGLRKKK
jgi:hypothetical protein